MRVPLPSAAIIAGALAWFGATGIAARQGPAATSAAPALPDARGRARTVQLCGDCHEIGTILGRRYSPSGWRTVIDDMAVLGAVFTDDEVDIVVGYLGVHFGTVNVNTASIEDMELVLELTPAQARQVETARRLGQRLASVDDVAKVTGLEREALEARKDRMVFAE